mmetsp:Transcript_9755/g.19754  ORF Transcript_9755/g.19754 Transcript_9755/m.19754 type:complete len:633 (-) Transcript_9755:31-1929(-)
MSMDASESPSAATAEKNSLASDDDVVAEDTPAAKSILHDDDKIMQTIFDKSTSSSSPPITDEDNIQKAISFLRNNEIRDVSPSEKRKYLTTKGINQDEIDTALDRLVTTTTAAAIDRAQGGSLNRDEGRPYQHRQQQNQQHYQQQQNQYGGPPHSTGPLPPYQNHMQPPHNSMNNFGPNNNNNMGNIRPDDGGESSFLSFSSLAGGFCMSTFCLAAVRWLNGGDFVLFPPPIAEGRYIKQDSNETQNEDDNEDEETTDHLDETYNSQGSGDPDLSMILNGTANHESDVHGNNQEQSSFEDLVMEVKALSTTINSFREEQDRANRVATAQLGKGVTDDAMDFLRQQKPPVVQKKGDVAAIDKKDVSRITCLITEMVEELSQVKDSLGDVTVEEDENSNTENDDDDKKTDHTELSSKIDIAIGKGREILALVKSPDESSSNKIQPQQAPPAEQENDEKDSDQDSNNTAQEEKGIKDDNEDKTESDSTPAADDSSGESSDIDQNSKDLEEALKILSQKNESEELKIGAQMLYLYCKNLSKNPTVPRYRKIYTNNNSFKKKVGNLVGAKEFLSALGFVERSNFFEWSETSPGTKSQLDFALVALEQIQKWQVGDTGSAGSDTSGDKSEQNEVIEAN